MDIRLKYYLQIADNALILSHRLGEVVSQGPYLEEDIANTNVALDLIGMAESVYEQAAIIEDKGRTGDDLVYRRSEHEFFNVNLVEQPNKDFAYILVRQFLMDAFHVYFLTELTKSKDEFLSAVAIKSLKEVTYHLRRSSEWMIRLGDGTEESHAKIQESVDTLWRYTGELFFSNEVDALLLNEKIGVDIAALKKPWEKQVREILGEATIEIPAHAWQQAGGRTGVHSEHLGYLLTELQYMQRAYPGMEW